MADMAVATISSSDVGSVAALLGGLAGLVVIGGATRAWWRRTLGRRADRYARLARLGTGAHLSFFVAVLGEPPAMSSTVVKDDYIEYALPGDPDWDDEAPGGQERRVRRAFLVSTFIDRDYYVQTISDDDNTVLAFSVTTRSRRFQPVLQIPRSPGPIARWRWQRTHRQPYRGPVYVKLGRTSFSDLDSVAPESFSPPHFRIMMGAHNHAYSEMVYKGNPGYYQTFVWTASDAARQGRFGKGMAVAQEIKNDEWPKPDGGGTEPEWSNMPETQRFRRETVITTYTVIGVSLGLENYPIDRFGPHENLVRTLP
jgi:hypothetical protein